MQTLKNKKLDSLKIIGNAFIVEKDSIDNNGFNQIKGGILNGNFVDGNLKVATTLERITRIKNDILLPITSQDLKDFGWKSNPNIYTCSAPS